MKISIIIPALNEEKYLPKLLRSIKRQFFKDYEVIVADAGSKDNTKKIAKKFGARVVKGGMPAAGRNAGAKTAKGDYLFFFDSDIIIPKNFLEKSLKEMDERNLDIATSKFLPISRLISDRVMHGFANLFMRISQFSNPRAPGFCIIIKKPIFEKIKGFNENLKLAEDHDLIKRALKFGKFRVLNTTKFWVSVRRMEKEGRLNIIWKYFLVEMHLRLKGNITKDIVKYEFGDFKQ